MNVVDNRTTRKENYKYQTTDIIYDQSSMSIIKVVITKSNSHQINRKRKKLTFTSIENIWTCLQCDWLTGRQERARRCEVQKYVPLLKTINFTVINVIRYQKQSLKSSFISP